MTLDTLGRAKTLNSFPITPHQRHHHRGDIGNVVGNLADGISVFSLEKGVAWQKTKLPAYSTG
ncbi:MULTISPECIES: hypothetical protein [Neorhizobium]|uniref:hypothetical protein n=1 Tax=Neorhizobium TaxID=1525371 RepID=UPI00155EA4B4|nr:MULTISPECIES: hypothetical protein [Neorhizobium]